MCLCNLIITKDTCMNVSVICQDLDYNKDYTLLLCKSYNDKDTCMNLSVICQDLDYNKDYTLLFM